MDNNRLVQLKAIYTINDVPVLFLEDVRTGLVIPIWISHAEAEAIVIAREKVKTARPLTHELMQKVIEELEGKLESVAIKGYFDSIYYAILLLRDKEKKKKELDARPSDAVALAARIDVPIYISEEVFIKCAREWRFWEG